MEKRQIDIHIPVFDKMDSKPRLVRGDKESGWLHSHYESNHQEDITF